MKKIYLIACLLITSIFISCGGSNENEGTSQASSITISSTTSDAFINFPIYLSTKTNTNQDVSLTAKYYVNGNLIPGKNYTPTTTEALSIYSTYTIGEVTLTSQTIEFTPKEPINFNKRVLIEDFTGTWCQYCPRVAYAIDLVSEETSNLTVVAIHRGNDPFNFAGAAVLESQIGLRGYPLAMLNRNTEWAYPETSSTSIAQAVNMTTGLNPRLGIAMEAVTTGNTGSVNVKVKFGRTFSNLKLVVYAVEDNLRANQSNSTAHYGGGNPLVNFKHDNVLRAVLTNSILGEGITGSTGYNEVFSKTFSYTIPSGVTAANVRYVAVVIDATGKALNSRAVGPNDTQVFEID